jgi:hypothetical protein
MQKFIPIALLAILIVGCKGGDTTAATTGGGEASTTGATASADGSYTFKLNPKQGEKYTYVTQGSAMGMSTEQTMTMTVEKVDGDKFTIVTTMDGMKVNGKEATGAAGDALKKLKITSVMDSTGKSLETKLEGAPAGTPTPETPMTAFPAKAVKVGDTWEGTTKMQGADVKVSYKLAKVEGNVATLESTMEGLPMGLTTDGPTIVEMDMATGMMISTTAKMKMKGPDGKEMAITSETKRK